MAKPSLSHSWSHQAKETRLPNHWWATWGQVGQVGQGGQVANGGHLVGDEDGDVLQGPLAALALVQQESRLPGGEQVITWSDQVIR